MSTSDAVAPLGGAPTPARRILAYLLDGLPRWAVLVIAGVPVQVLLLGELGVLEGILGVGIFDPALGGDPFIINAATVRGMRALPWLFGLAGWTAIQTVLVGLAGASLGKLATGLRVLSEDQGQASRLRLMGREIARDSSGAILIATAGAYGYVRAPVALFGLLVLEIGLIAFASFRSARRILRDGGARSWLDVVARTVVRQRRA